MGGSCEANRWHSRGPDDYFSTGTSTASHEAESRDADGRLGDRPPQVGPGSRAPRARAVWGKLRRERRPEGSGAAAALAARAPLENRRLHCSARPLSGGQHANRRQAWRASLAISGCPGAAGPNAGASRRRHRGPSACTRTLFLALFARRGSRSLVRAGLSLGRIINGSPAESPLAVVTGTLREKLSKVN